MEKEVVGRNLSGRCPDRGIYRSNFNPLDIPMEIQRLHEQQSFDTNILMICAGAPVLAPSLYSPIAFHKQLMDCCVDATSPSTGIPSLHTIGAWEIWGRPHWGINHGHSRDLEKLRRGIAVFNNLLQRDMDVTICPGKLQHNQPGVHQYIHPESPRIALISKYEGSANMVYNMMRDVGGAMHWIKPNTPLHIEWVETMNPLKSGDLDQIDLAGDGALLWHEAHNYHFRFGSRVKPAAPGYDNTKSLLSFPPFYFDVDCKKALYQESNGNKAAIRYLSDRYQDEKAFRAERREKLYPAISELTYN